MTVTIGVFARVCPDLVATRLGDFIRPWCKYVKQLDLEEELTNSYLGLVDLIRLNPNGCFDSFAHICDAICSWEGIPQSVQKRYYSVLQLFKSHIGAGWEQYIQQVCDSYYTNNSKLQNASVKNKNKTVSSRITGQAFTNLWVVRQPDFSLSLITAIPIYPQTCRCAVDSFYSYHKKKKKKKKKKDQKKKKNEKNNNYQHFWLLYIRLDRNGFLLFCLVSFFFDRRSQQR